MLAGGVLLWALNITLSKVILEHGFEPLAYSALRYGAASAIFVALSRSVRLTRRQAYLVAALAAAVLFVNQVAFVYALRLTTASTVGLMFGATPIVTALLALAVGTERPTRRFAAAALVSFGGVALVAVGSGGGLSGDLGGDLLAFGAAATWGVYSVAISVLMRDYSAIRVSAVVLPLTMIPIV